MAILYRKENDNEVKTAIIETSSAQDSPEDAITLSFHDTIIYPEETAH